MQQEASLQSAIALREQYRDNYSRKHDPIAQDRLLWRSQTFRHTVHLLPGETILELGCGEGWFTRALLETSRGENPITVVSFQQPLQLPSDLQTKVEVLSIAELLGPQFDRRFDCVVAIDILDRSNSSQLLSLVYTLLAPGGEMVLYESNPWNPVHKLRWILSHLAGKPDPRSLVSRPELYELISEIGFVRIYAVYNDFVFAPLTRRMVWLLRNLSILLENAPIVRTMAGSILLHAQKPPRAQHKPKRPFFVHPSLRASISVVIPCHNEQSNVGRLIEAILELYGDYVHEIIPVDDNSTDDTRVVISEMAKTDARIKPLFRSPPNGVGRAIADGLTAATGRYILSIDCDFQHLLPEFRDLFDKAAEGYDVVVGSRFSRHSVLLNYPFMKIVANRAFHGLARLLLRRDFRDLTNNLKLMRREVVTEMQLQQAGFAVNAETGLQPLLLGYRVAEVPISWINRSPGMGASSFRLVHVGSGYWRVLLDIWLKQTFNAGRYRGLGRRPSYEQMS